jgi:hypothetical protein
VVVLFSWVVLHVPIIILKWSCKVKDHKRNIE